MSNRKHSDLNHYKVAGDEHGRDRRASQRGTTLPN